MTKAYGGVQVLTGLSLHAERGDRLGLVGANGAGKSTVLRLIAGREQPDGGTMQLARRLRIGYLPQETSFRSDRTLRQAMLAVFSDLRDWAARLRDLEARLAEAGSNPASWDPAVLDEYTTLLSRFEERGGYTHEQRVEQVLDGLDFARDLWDQPTSALSGGQKTRARLARLLLEEPDFLLLDEPTNHLDLATTEWLEGFLTAWKGGLMVVSHDRYFLDRVTRRTIEVVDGRAESYPAPFSRYLYLRAERYRRQQKAHEMQQARIAKTEDFIRRYGAGQRAKQARGRQKHLDSLERVEGAPRGKSVRGLTLQAGTRGGEVVLSTVRLRAGYEAKPLLALPNVQVARGERIAVIGANGAGKSTLLKTLMGQTPPLGGSFAWGADVEPGYYAQGHEGLRRDRTVLATLQDAHPMSEEQARSYLGRFLFSGDDVLKKIGDLSGGERSRVALASLTLKQSNMLLLDEPTNHLDIQSRDALEHVLRDSNTTMIFVSHDRYFIDAVATSVWAVVDGAVYVYPGTYAAYLEARAAGTLPAPPPDEAPRDGVVERERLRGRGAAARAAAAFDLSGTGRERDEATAALVEQARATDAERGALAARLARMQGQTLDDLLALAATHHDLQEDLARQDTELLTALHRRLEAVR